MTSILITGANGFIGSGLVKALSSLKYRVKAVDANFGDIALKETWERMPTSKILIHLAAKSEVPLSWNFPSDFVQTNCVATSLALEYCRFHKAKLIFLSSYIYADSGSQPIHENSQICAKNPYALTKLFSEQLCEMFNKNFGVESQIIRPFNVYGPNQNENFLIPKIIREAQIFGTVNIKDIEPRRDFVYVEDLISAIIKLINYNGPYRTFNIGTGQSHSVLDVIEIVQNLLRHSIEVRNENVRRPDEILDSVANIDLARLELGWTPKVSLSEGLFRMIS